MSGAHDISAESARLDGVFREKARAEITVAEQAAGGMPAVRAHGDELAEVLLLKGEPGPGDIEGGYALAGPDGDAAEKALDALGLPAARFALCTRVPDVDLEDRAARIRTVVEAVDPLYVIALDPLAAEDLAVAVGIDPPVAGTPVTWRGRTVVAIDGLEASLSDDALKRRVWRQLKALAAADAPQT